MRVKIVPQKELFRDDESGFKIYSAEVQGEKEVLDLIELNNFGNISLQGNNLPDFNLNAVYDLEVEKAPKSKYKGSYLMIKSYYIKPQEPEDQWKFLSMVVTQNQYKDIAFVYSEYEDKIIDIINNNEFDYENVRGYGEKTYEDLKVKIKENMEISEALSYFSEYEIPYNTIKRMVDRYGTAENTITAIEGNPYSIIEKDGFGFVKADELAMKLGIDPESKERISSCMTYILEEVNKNGDVWIGKRKMHNRMKSLLKVSKESIKNVMEEDNENVFVYDNKYATKSSAVSELDIADNLYDRVNNQKSKLKELGYNAKEFVEEFEEKSGMILADRQREFIESLDKTNILFLIGNAGSGKALKNSSSVQTPRGPVRIDSLNVGDKVFGADGNVCSVLGVYPQGKKEVWEVEFSDGTIIECCEEHLWTYQTASMRTSKAKNATKWKTDSLKNITKNVKLRTKSGRGERNNLYIPMTEPVKYRKNKLPIPPYALGAMIGDGSMSQMTGSVGFTNEEEDVSNRVNRDLNEIGYYLKRINKRAENHYSVNLIDSSDISHHQKGVLMQSLEDLELRGKKSEYKFIPDKYKYSDVEDRLELLKGLIDTDGYINGSAYEYTTSSKRLAYDVKELVESLGMTASLGFKEKPTYIYKGEKLIGNPSHRLLIKTTKKITKIHSSLKHESNWKSGQSIARRYVKSIKKTDKLEEMTCISVDNKDKLFLTDNFVVTHNTQMQKIVIDLANKMDMTYTLLAPTGRASKVMSEYTGAPASTIHRGLGLMSIGKMNEKPVDVINTDIVLIDEASMCDIPLADSLLSGINKNSLVIFIGDDAQIPSVGEGNFLYDCINSEDIPVIKLNKIFRQKQSGMLDAITKTRQAKSFLNPNNPKSQRRGNNFEFRHMIKERVAENISSSYIKMLKNGYSPEDIGVMLPTNIGEIGTININRIIQEIVNPKNELQNKEEHIFGSKDNQRIIRVGDYVMNTKNIYDAEVVNDVAVTDIYNGDCGHVIAVNNSRKEVIVDFEGKHILFDFNQVTKSLIHAWAITTYKAQGSQYRAVLVVVDGSATYQLNANLLYTGMSRAREFLGVFGQAATFNKALKKFANFTRQSFLNEFIDIRFNEESKWLELSVNSLDEKGKELIKDELKKPE